MNSSVTCDSATSVTSSLCLAIRPSSRSNGPSKSSRWTWKPPPGALGGRPRGRLVVPRAAQGGRRRCPSTAGPGHGTCRPGSPDAHPMPTGRPAPGCGCRPPSRSRARPALLLAVGLEVGEHHGHGLADDPAAVDGQAVVRAAPVGPARGRTARCGHVDGDLLVVPLPAAGLALRRRRAGLRAGRGGAARARPAGVPAVTVTREIRLLPPCEHLLGELAVGRAPVDAGRRW